MSNDLTPVPPSDTPAPHPALAGLPLPDAAALGKVAVLMGGRSAEREVSLMSGQGVLAALRSEGVDAHPFDPAERPLEDLVREGFARCFIALHGRHGEDGTVQGALELLGLPYTGSGVRASAIAMDKITTKRLWRGDGLSTADWRVVHSAEALAEALQAMGAPLMVKPAQEGSSIGITKVTHADEVAAAYALAARYDPEVLVEQFIDGEEVTCSVLGEGDGARALPLVRIVAPGGNYDYEHKYFSDDTQYFCPSGLPAQEEAAIQALVVAAYRSLGCRGWGRAEVMLRRSDRRPFLLEMNTSPGMTGHSLVPMSARVAGLPYARLCRVLLGLARLD